MSRLGLSVLTIAVLGLVACNRTPAPEATVTTPASTPATASTRAYTDQDISDAYIYLLSRLLVLRQQQLDFKEGFRWNELRHRKPGGVDWPNPNLDVAYSEAWVAVDENSCTIVTLPKITGRYYTVQFLNGWGETLANINERTQPKGAGEYAVCLKGANVQLPANVTRIDLPVKYSRVLARIELGKDWDEAVALQHKITFRATGSPTPPTLPAVPDFAIAKPPGVEAFELAPAVLDSEADLNPGMDAVRAKVLAIAQGVKDPQERARVDQVIRDKALPDFFKASKILGHGTVRNQWVRPSTVGVYHDDWLTRSLVNQGGIWANTMDEVVYYKGGVDADGANFNGDHVYTITFPKDALPPSFANYFWSVIAVDGTSFRVLPNPQNRFLLNKQSKLEYGKDGSLTLYFAAEKPADAPEGNWLPTPRGQDYRLTFRFYGPKGGVADGTYFPPPVIKRS
ncbi:DUF1214 domain-containing protein [Lysobacter sp. FW306-1B-D06B]|uniref:DUF1214 domain-containing protein n=1 Tax=Lysobacter sp. FW306-1B-D06B TaxID=3140250 RepID=UPI0031402897